jgi:hypothetical protein
MYLLLLVLTCSTVYAQERTHTGFYLSMSLGPAFGGIDAKSSNGENLSISGTGAGFDLQIGGAVKENLILHAVIGAKSIVGPSINGTSLDDDYSISETIFGGGVTYYLANNIFFTGNLGSGSFSFDSDDTSLSTDNGFSFQLKTGKEWWVSSRWGLGVVLEYGATSLTDKYSGGSDKWTSSRYSIRFIATLNGKRR